MLLPEESDMGTPASQPIIPKQPALLAYGVQDLGLFSTYSRETYLAAFAVQAPAWDPTRVAKTWFDTSVDISSPGNVAVYKIAAPDQNGIWGLRQLVLPAQEAATVNLPGTIAYAPYVVAPTRTTTGGALIDAMYLSLEADAQALMTALSGSGLVVETGNAAFPIIYPPDEPRRMWDFTVNGVVCNAGALLTSEYANGVGAPGSWQASVNGPVWVPAPPAPTGLNDMRPARPMPVRDLLPNEELQAGLMGVSVVRIDLQQQQNAQTGEFTPDDRATLQQIYQIVNKLA
jgi:hypothetical protein